MSDSDDSPPEKRDIIVNIEKKINKLDSEFQDWVLARDKAVAEKASKAVKYTSKGKIDKRSLSSAENVRKAREKVKDILKFNRKILNDEMESSESENEIILTKQKKKKKIDEISEPKIKKKKQVEIEEEEEEEEEEEPKPKHKRERKIKKVIYETDTDEEEEIKPKPVKKSVKEPVKEKEEVKNESPVVPSVPVFKTRDGLLIYKLEQEKNARLEKKKQEINNARLRMLNRIR